MIEIFFSYAHEDEELMNEVRRQLVIFERTGRIVKWHDRKIPAGSEWRREIDSRLERANIVLLFVSPHFIESRYCYEVEGQAALRRHDTGEAHVIPVILRPCPWQEAPFSKLQAVPRDAKPITQWNDRDEACLDVARGIMAVVEKLIDRSASTSRQSVRAPQETGDARHKDQAEVKSYLNAQPQNGVTTTLGGNGRPLEVEPQFLVSFRPNDSASEPNYYVEIVIRNGPRPLEEPFRLMVLLYTPRNPWDKRPWPVNVQPTVQPYVSCTSLSHSNSVTFFQTLEQRSHSGFHLLTGFEARSQKFMLFPGDLFLVSTLEVFGPDLMVDWVLDTGRDQTRGTTRCSRPVDSALPWHFRGRSRLQVELCDTHVKRTPDGNRLHCNLVIREHGYQIGLSCWAECLDQWGNDLTAKYLVMDGLKQSLIDIRSQIATIRPQERHDSPLERLAEQLLIEAPIRFDTFYSELIQHYTAAGDLERVPLLQREWEEALSQLTLPDVTGLEGIV